MILGIRCTRCGNMRGADQPLCRHCALWRVTYRLRYAAGLAGDGAQPATTRRGLASAYNGLWRRESGIALTVPWGWRKRKVENRDLVEVMPLWLYWLVSAWDDRYWWTFGTLKRLGLWQVRTEGGEWVKGRPTAPRWWRRFWWCFLHDADRAPLT